ncbi:MAG: hypothetical protein AAFN81_13065 [Bacteroidota bacterium]
MKEVVKWLSLIPLAWLIIFLAFCLRAINKLGQMPLPHNPDPSDLNFDFHLNSVWLLGYVSLLICTPIALGYDFYNAVKGERKPIKEYISRIWIVIFILVLILNPFDLINWLLD